MERSEWLKPQLIIVVLLALLIGGAIGYWIRANQAPAASSVEVRFAQDMSEHHRQAVEMATLLYPRTEDERMRAIAYDIMLTQQGQIGIMSGWLDTWGQPAVGSGPAMEWMGMPTEGLMPGMATREQLNELAAATGEEADAIFIGLMVPHHRSGIMMAQAAADRVGIPYVQALAEGMVNSQQEEIGAMERILEEKGFPPLPAP